MDDQILAKLRTEGFAIVDPIWGIEETNAWLMDRMVFADAHVPQTARNRGNVMAKREAIVTECLCVHTDDAIRAPYIFERALSLTDIVAAYLQRDPPVMYSANVFWTRPGPGAMRPDIQGFHSDADDARFLAMFVYLTDVLTVADGPQDLAGPDGVVRTIFGHAGTVFLADTSRQHRGRKPQSHERGLAWFRWGVGDRPAAGVWDKIEPISAASMGDRYPTDPRLRESIKLLVV